MRLELRVRRSSVPAGRTQIWLFTRVGALVIILCLVCGECFCTERKTAGVGAVTGVEEQMAAEFGALFEVFAVSGAVFPLADALRAVVHMGGFDVFM